MHVFRRCSVYFRPLLLRSGGGVTAHISYNRTKEIVCHMDASFVILRHLIRVSIEAVLCEVVCPPFGYV